MSPSGLVSTIVGNGSDIHQDGSASASAPLGSPYGVAYDTVGNLYTTETSWNTVRMITPGGVLSTPAGNASNVERFADGVGSAASFAYPSGLTFASGNAYVADNDNHCIRMISPT